MINFAKRAVCGLAAASCAATTIPAYGQSSAFTDDPMPPAHLGTRSDASVGLYMTLPFGGPAGTNWQDKTQFSVAYRVSQTRAGFASSPVGGFSGDMFAIRFRQDGFDRFSLSGRDLYLRDGSLSLYATNEEEDEAGDKGGSNTAIWIGLGVVAVVGGGLAAANKAGDAGAAVGECIVNVIVGQTCDD